MSVRDIACIGYLLSPFAPVVIYGVTGIDIVAKVTRGRWELRR